jgi:hypothetical protein
VERLIGLVLSECAGGTDLHAPGGSNDAIC